MSEPAKQRYAWIDFAKGICICAVVTLYTTTYLEHEVGRGGWLDYWVAFAKPFRMPDFFLLSGLFLGRVIDRPWGKYLDKKVVHYLYFLFVWTLIIVPLSWSEATWSTMTPEIAVKGIIWHLHDPWAMLWFIQMLAIYFVVTRLVRRVPWPIVLLAAALLHAFPYETGLKPVDVFGERYVFFYAGYIFAKRFFALVEWTEAHASKALGLIVAWAFINGAVVFSGHSTVTGVPLVLGFAGACAVMCIAALLSRFPSMRWLSFLGAHSICVYLGFYLPMHLFIWIFTRLHVPLDPGTLAAVIAVLSIGASVALWRLTKGTFLSFLFERPRWVQMPYLGAAPATAVISAAPREKR